MDKFATLNSVAAPIMRENIDTDVIIPINRLVGNAVRGSLGKWGFTALRYKPDGSENPEFILNREPYRGAQILLTGVNFGCGSSREGAVWALQEMGIRCVIGSSFGDIFFNNCFQNGLLPVVLDRRDGGEPRARGGDEPGCGPHLGRPRGDDGHGAVRQALLVRCRARAPRGAAGRASTRSA